MSCIFHSASSQVPCLFQIVNQKQLAQLSILLSPFFCSFSRIRHHAVPLQWAKPCQSPEVGTKPGGGEGQTRLFAISAATLHRLRVGIVHIFVVSKAGSAANGWEGARPRTNKVANTAWNNTTSRARGRPQAKRNPGKTRRLTSAKVDVGAPPRMKTSPHGECTRRRSDAFEPHCCNKNERGKKKKQSATKVPLVKPV